MTSTYSTNKAIEEPANGDYVNTWSTPVNSNFNIIDTAFGGHVIINATGASGTVALTTAQYQNLYILFSGTLSANVNYQVPSGVGGQWVVYNGTSGAFTLTLSSGGGGSSVTITQGTRTLIVSDGTNVTLSVNTVTSPGGADTSIQFNQSGVFGGSSNLAWNYGTNTLAVTGAVNVNGTSGTVAINSAGDYLTFGYNGYNSIIASGAAAQLEIQATGASGIISIATNGAERMRVTAAGNVGIGTSNPDSFYGNAVPLAVVKNQNAATIFGIGNNVVGASATTQINIVGGTSNSFLYQQLSDNNGSPFFTNVYGLNVNFQAWNFGGNERMRITAAGNVGIGTSSPGNNLQVYAAGTPSIALSNSTGQILQYINSSIGFFGTSSNTPMLFGANNSEAMRITGAGNIGIGTTSPVSTLTINGPGYATPSLSAAGGAVTISNNNDLDLQIGESSVTGSAGIYLQSKRHSNDGTSWQLYLNPLGGSVGIGTNAPAYLLDVNGTGRFVGSLLVNGGTALSSVTNPANNPITGTPSSSNFLRGDGTWAGTVTSITAGTGLSGGTITSSGTIALANTTVTAASYGSASSVATFTVNAQGQLTAASNTAIAIASGAVSGLAASATTDTTNASNITSGTLAVARGGTGLTSAGTSGNVLTSNGSAWVSSAPSSPPQIQTQILTVGSGTWTAPTGVTKVYVAVIGGGGGATSNYNGGSGGIAIGEYTVSPGTGYAYTVGAGGAGVTTSGTANAGGSSSFASFASATGGGAAISTLGPGADGTGTGGTLRNTSSLWTGLSTPMGGYQTTGSATNAASSWGINSLSQAGAFGYPTSGSVGLGGNSGGIYLMWVG